MNIGPIDTSLPAMPSSEGASVTSAAAAGDSNGHSATEVGNGTPAPQQREEVQGGAPEPLKQMATSDFLSLHESFREESVMDKLAKIFETILALKLLEETVENVNKSIEERIAEGE